MHRGENENGKASKRWQRGLDINLIAFCGRFYICISFANILIV